MNMKTLTETSTFRVLSLLLCLCFFIPAMNVSASSLQADKFKVSGIVKDATGEPVIGASVVEKGTTNGTVTDLDGNFNLTVASNSVSIRPRACFSPSYNKVKSQTKHVWLLTLL